MSIKSGTSIGYRPPTVQRVALGAGLDGVLTSQIHEVVSQTSMFDEFVEPSGMLTTMLYASPTLRVTHRLSRLNVGTPTYMRAPGESSGSFALESAMDELAYTAELDPDRIALAQLCRTRPHETDPVFEQIAARMLCGRCGGVRLEAAPERTAVDARPALLGGHGHGDGGVSHASQRGRRPRTHQSRWQRPGAQRRRRDRDGRLHRLHPSRG